MVQSGGPFQGLFTFVTQAAQEFAESRAQGREDDRYVVGGTHWDGFSHKSLFKMVWENADPVNVERLADTWTRQGESIANRSDDLQRSLDKLMQFWSGSAANEATATVKRNVDWLSDLGETAAKMSGPIDHAAGALRSAQQQMPAPPEGFSWSTLGGGAAAGFAVGGPVGAGIGAMISGIGSVFGGSSKKKKLKKRAVQTMQRFETAAMDVDGTTPAFMGPAAGTGGGGDPSLPGGGSGGVGTLPPDQRPLPGAPGGVPGGGTDTSGGRGVTVPSFVGGGHDPRWSALTGGPGAFGADVLGRGAGGAGAGGAGKFGAGLGGPFGGPGGLLGALPPGRGAGGVGAGARDMLRGGNRFGAAGRFGAGGAGMAGGPMAGRGANGDEDREYDRRFPLEEDLFSSDEKAAPPVIGL